MTRPLRIAYARINQETNCLSPITTTMDDFRSMHFLEGDALADACAPLAHEVKGYIRNAELSGFVRAAKKTGAELVPLISAWAVPGGPLTTTCFEELRDRLVAALLRAGPLDGLYLCLHGAMGAVAVRDPETEFLKAAREVVGDCCRIVATYDLHGILTDERVRAADAFVAYKTNPHRDHAKTGARAADLLVGAAQGTTDPVVAWRSLPMFLGGGTTMDFLAPMRGIYARMKAMEREAGVLSTSLFMCHPWNDDPALGWSVAVTTDGDRALADRLVEELAELAWGVKDQLPPTFAAADQAIDAARAARVARKLGVVVLADASDVVSAGAPGENTRLLRALIERGQGLLSYVPLRDPVAVTELWSAAEGARVDVSLGGRLDPARNEALAVHGVVQKKIERHGWGKVVVLAVGDVRVVVTEGPALSSQPTFYTGVGLDLWKADVVVVKNFFPFRLYFLPWARKTIYVRTAGVTDFDAAAVLPFDGPMHPRDVVTSWRDADRRRREAA